MKTERLVFSFLRLSFITLCCVLAPAFSFAKPHNPEERRIVSLAPSTTEWIVALGLEERLQGITDQCDFPPQIRNKPKMGSYLRASVERIFAARATDVVVADALPEVMRRRFEKSGVRVHVFAPQRLDDFPMRIRELGNALGAPHAAEQWSGKFRLAIEGARRDFANPKRASRRALMFVSVDPVFVVGHTQWLSDVFRLSGFENAFSDPRVTYAFPRLSFEVLAKLNADIWFGFGSGENLGGSQQAKLAEMGRRISRSVKPEIRILSADLFQRPGPRLLDAMAQLKGDSL
jgi:iron complex transport system substrate-binding protein